MAQDQNTKRRTFCFIFDINNEQLLKGHGLITYGMAKFKNFDSITATYDNAYYPNLKYVPGVRLEFIPKITGDFKKDAIAYLKDNARRIDVLFTMHTQIRSYKIVKAYKEFNPDGKIYIAMDGGSLSKLCWIHVGKFIISRPFQKWLMRNAVISTDFEEDAERFKKYIKYDAAWIPNPVNPDEVAPMRKFKDRSNIIFTSARLGTKQKATEILLSSFVKIADQIPDWKLKLAGGFSENVNIADDFYKAHPELQERVIFTGQVSDRASLIEMYRDAKIFAFPSRWEGSPLALNEAMSQGCFPVVSEIKPHRMLTDNFKYAFHHEVDDVDKLAECLLNACMNEKQIEAIAHDGMNFINNMCSLERCCDVIYKRLYDED